MKKNELKSLIRGYIICICVASGLFGLAAGATEASNRTKSRGQGINQQVINIDSLKNYVIDAAANRKGEKKPQQTTEYAEFNESYSDYSEYTFTTEPAKTTEQDSETTEQ